MNHISLLAIKKLILFILLATTLVSANNTDTHYDRAIQLMKKTPLLDTHIDLPQVIRSLARKPLDAIPEIAASFPGHVDIPRIREGHLGGAFWSIWTPCDDNLAFTSGNDFTKPTNALRDALEMLDLIQNMIAQHPDHLQYAHSSADIMRAFGAGKVASLLGMEGTHFLGNSLSTVRIFAQLGVRYLTLTHICHSAFASSAGAGTPLDIVHDGNGLSKFGRELVLELNRVGIIIDLSHTSDFTARQAIELSRAPVVWTHSGSRTMWNHPRNVPNDLLDLLGDGPDKKDGLVQSVFYPPFISHPETANLSDVADHIEYIANRIGRHRVGIASDFDGMYSSVRGLEDASKYPYLVAEMLHRGWNDSEVRGLLGRNLMRIMDRVDEVKLELQHELPSSAIWEGRKDSPSTHWGGGPEQPYYPYSVRDAINNKYPVHDEL